MAAGSQSAVFVLLKRAVSSGNGDLQGGIYKLVDSSSPMYQYLIISSVKVYFIGLSLGTIKAILQMASLIFNNISIIIIAAFTSLLSVIKGLEFL